MDRTSIQPTQTGQQPAEKAEKRKTQQRRKPEGEDTIMNRMAQWQYSAEQKAELHKMMAMGMGTQEILTVFYPETDVLKMREIRRTYRVVKNSSE